MFYVIDDNKGVRESLCLLLESYGFKAFHYSSGAAFLRDVKPDDNGVLITDINMPDICGLELIAQLRHARNIIQAILMTANVTNQMLAAANQLGVPALRKPFSPTELFVCIEQLSRRNRP